GGLPLWHFSDAVNPVVAYTLIGQRRYETRINQVVYQPFQLRPVQPLGLLPEHDPIRSPVQRPDREFAAPSPAGLDGCLGADAARFLFRSQQLLWTPVQIQKDAAHAAQGVTHEIK